MGVYYTSYALLGVKFSIKKLIAKTSVPNCEHTIPAGARFCPICGEKSGTHIETDRSRAESFMDYVHEETPMPNPRFTLIDAYDDREIFYFGYSASSDRDESEFHSVDELPSFADILKEAEAFLTQFGLWDDQVSKTLGLYSLTIGH